MGDAEDIVRHQENSTKQQWEADQVRHIDVLNKEIQSWLYLALINLRYRNYAVHPKWCASRRWMAYNGEQRLAWILYNSYSGAAEVEHYTCVLADGTLVEGSEGSVRSTEWGRFTVDEATAVLRSLWSMAIFPRELPESKLRDWLFQNGIIKSRNPYA